MPVLTCIMNLQKPADKEELPPWARNEQARKLAAEDGSSGIPFGVYLLGSALVAIASVRQEANSCAEAV